MHSDGGAARTRAWSLWALASALAFAVFACALQTNTKRTAFAAVAPQQWQGGRGPVVPHDTFPRDCSTCHEGSSWHAIKRDLDFDHARETGVALNGAHATAECLRCHNDRGPVAQFAERGCSGCHEDVHRAKQGARCDVCHTERDWQVKDAIALHQRTRFPLVGAHAATECSRCHAGAQVGNFDRTNVDCLACHARDLSRAIDPDHALLGYTTNCDRCHTSTTWNKAEFAHAFFPLLGAHASANCNGCHTDNSFQDTPTVCKSCHLSDYYGATDPDHRGADFPLTCQQCHSTFGWSIGMFDHSSIVAPCITCHAADFNFASNPNHVAVGKPTNCALCHNTTSWRDTYFNHFFFPITSGAHAGFVCNQCHTRAQVFRVFSCTSCHDHAERPMARAHARVRGYAYTSEGCFECHPNSDVRRR